MKQCSLIIKEDKLYLQNKIHRKGCEKLNEKKISKRKKGFKETTKVIAETGIALIAILLLANVVYAAVSISDGFDYPVGILEGNGYGVECCGRLSFLEKWDHKKDGSLLS